MTDLMKQQPRKSVGTGGVHRLLVPGNDANGSQGETVIEHLPSNLPDSKPEIEEKIANSFAGSRIPGSLLISSVKQLPVDDFDFVVQTNQGEKYLELIEFVPAPPHRLVEGESHYQYSPYEHATWALENALAKSAKYTGSTQIPIVLLIYSTRWQFSDCGIAHLRHWLLRRDHCFDSVYFHAVGAMTNMLYPPPVDFWTSLSPIEATGPNPERFKGDKAMMFGPTAFKPMSGGIFIKVPEWK